MTDTQRYIFNAILKIFGKNIEGHIYVLTTFADANDPPVLNALAADKVPYVDYFKFNNSALFVENTSSDNCEFQQMYWQMGKKSFEKFFKVLATTKPVSLRMTKEVLNRLYGIQIAIAHLQERIAERAVHIASLEDKKKFLQKQTDKLNEEIEIRDYREELVDVGKHYATNCTKCKETCHVPCKNALNLTIRFCEVFSKGKCEVCRGHCDASAHERSKQKYVRRLVKKYVTRNELLAEYSDKVAERKKTEWVIDKLERNIQKYQHEIIWWVKIIRSHHNELHYLALRPKPLTDMAYLDTLIENEKNLQREMWRERLQIYERLKQNAHLFTRVVCGNICELLEQTSE